VAGIPGEEATVKTFVRKRNKIILRPANEIAFGNDVSYPCNIMRRFRETFIPPKTRT